MRWRTPLAAAGLMALSVAQTGCQLARSVAHNLANESAEQWDQRRLSRQLRAEARNAWAAYRGRGGTYLSADFADGFQDGYADYLESGGNGTPPAVPPARYRRREFLNPEGHARVRDYFAGFQVGIEDAAASGRRPFLTVPVLLADPAAPAALPGIQVPTTTMRAGEQLPAPRGMEPTTGLPIPDRPLAAPVAPPPIPVPAKAAPQPEPEVKPPPVPVRTTIAEPRPLADWPPQRVKLTPADEVPIGPRRVERN